MMQLSLASTSFVVGIASSSPIRSIQLSYFVFSPLLAGFVSYGGIASQPTINGTLYQVLQMSLSTLTNYLVGITGFSTTSLSGSFSFTTNIDPNFILGMTGSIYNVTASFVIFGNSPNTVCSQCPGTIPSYDRCVQSCAADQALFTYLDSSKGCINCPSYAHLMTNPTKTDCTC